MPTTCLPHISHTSTTCLSTCPPHVCHMSTGLSNMSNTGLTLGYPHVEPHIHHSPHHATTCPPYIYHTSNTCLPHVYRMSAAYLPHIHHMPAACQLHIYPMSHACPPHDVQHMSTCTSSTCFSSGISHAPNGIFLPHIFLF